jgi:hypothetical protein
MAVNKYCEITAEETAKRIGNISPSGVDKACTSALAKLRRNPRYRRLWREYGEARRSNNVGSLYPDEYGE